MPQSRTIAGRSLADLVLFAVTAAEIVLLWWLTPALGIVDWIYVTQHAIVLGIALTRGSPLAQDRGYASNTAVVVAYTYPYAQVACLHWVSGDAVWPALGFVMVALAACLSCASLVTLGRCFGVRPALRGLATGGPYRIVRHPMYLAYLIADIGYNLQGWNPGTLALVAAGWGSLLYRIRAEERILSAHPDWPAYSARTRCRLVPGLW